MVDVSSRKPTVSPRHDIQREIEITSSPELEISDLGLTRTDTTQLESGTQLVDHDMSGIPLFFPTPEYHLFTDASNSGRGAHMDDLKIPALWNGYEKDLQIKCREMTAISSALRIWKAQFSPSSVLMTPL